MCLLSLEYEVGKHTGTIAALNLDIDDLID